MLLDSVVVGKDKVSSTRVPVEDSKEVSMLSQVTIERLEAVNVLSRRFTSLHWIRLVKGEPSVLSIGFFVIEERSSSCSKTEERSLVLVHVQQSSINGEELTSI